MSNAQSLLQNVYLFKELTPKELETIAATAKLQKTLENQRVEHAKSIHMSPVEYEKQYFQQLSGV